MTTDTLLIADENAERAQTLLERVKSDSWSASIAGSLQAAKDAVTSRPLSVLLADGPLWHDGGLGAHVAAANPSLPVVVLTARTDASASLVQHLQLGAMTFLPRDSGRRRLVETIQGILDITRRNPYRERVKSFLRTAEVELVVGNDPQAACVIVGYLQRVLEDYGLSNERDRFRVGVALTEAISNSMIHGNLEVSSDLREDGADGYYDAIERQRQIEPFKSREVHIGCRITQSSATFIIRDQGKGFNAAALPDPDDPANIGKVSGRGMLLMKAYTDLVSWNDAGNEVTLVKSLTE